ncbi:MAG TPA: hypothetical protein VI997_10615 [Candidatus Thermoplasmatota archaeon]|nr:hypothetical protein [Candidatus Thermoplasmatota archaeon]
MRGVALALLLPVAALATGCLAPGIDECAPNRLGDVPLEVIVVRNETDEPVARAWVRALEVKAAPTGAEFACESTDDAGKVTLRVIEGTWQVSATKRTDDDRSCAYEDSETVDVPTAGTLEMRLGEDRKVCA